MQSSWLTRSLSSKPNKERKNTGQFSDDDSNGSRTPRNFSRSSLDHGGGGGGGDRTPREGYESSHNDQADHELTDASDYIDDNDVDSETKVIGPAIGPQI